MAVGKFAAQEWNDISIRVRIDRIHDGEDSNIRAFASVKLGEWFAVHGIKVIHSEKGLFVAMPQSKHKKEGKMQYQDIFHPITAEARMALNSLILSAYEEKLQEGAETAHFAQKHGM